ncbi:MAG: hypothetical protein HXX19_17005 [Rhodoferax sp.]|nr:hypothetical protein [Rhodoferax sp.]
MQRTALSLLLGLLAVSSSAFAGDWKLLPVRDADFKPEVTVSAVGGSLDPQHSGAGTYSGIELALNCLLLQPPSGAMRTHIALGQFDHDGLKLTDFEINPRWTVKLNPDLSFGVGPGIGLVKAEIAGQSATLFAMQLGADLDYKMGPLNLGLGLRWQATEDKEIVRGRSGADNALLQARIGFNF